MFNNFMPSPIMNAYQSPMAMYAHGGHINNHRGYHDPYPYHHEAQMLRHYGMGKDRILAHINPAEASYLQQHHGMSINPHTGLPQFGFFDMLKSGASQLGGAAMAAAPGLWADYGRPMAQQGLEALDKRIQGSLPGMAESLGSRFGGERGGQLGASLGRGLSNQMSQYGGLAGQVLPRVDTRMGVQGPAQFPQFGRGSMGAAATDIGKGMWKDTGRGMARGALQNVDEGIMGALPNVGSRVGGAVGSRFGMRDRGAALGAQVGGNLGSRYGDTSGIGGYAMPRMNQAVQNFGRPREMGSPPVPQMPEYMEEPQFAYGGHVGGRYY